MRPLRIFAALLTVAAFGMPLEAFAQTMPAPPPSYARPAAPNGEESITGRVARIDGKYALQLRDDRGFMDSVQLHQGTVINPTGLQLREGMTVTILGYNAGHAFAANEIDTPYMNYGFARPAASYAIGVGFGPVYYH